MLLVLRKVVGEEAVADVLGQQGLAAAAAAAAVVVAGQAAAAAAVVVAGQAASAAAGPEGVVVKRVAKV
eukprot:SAG22_NODE_17209_length_309_cov_0.976190_1_plen_69_part_10